MSETSASCPQAADLDARPSPLLVLVDHVAAQRDGLQVIQGLLLAAASLTLHLGERVHHRHVHVQVVGLLETFLAYLARKLQVGLCLVLGHVVFQGGSLATLEAADFASGIRYLGPTILLMPSQHLGRFRMTVFTQRRC